DLIVTSGQLAPAWELLRGIAPTYVISVYDKGAEPYQRARNMLLTLAEILGRQERAQEVLAEQDRVMTRQRQRLQAAGLAGTPVALVNFMDDRHVRINAPNGILQAGLEGLGLRNAWQQPGNFWGFAMVGLEALSDMDDARLVAIRPLAPSLPEQLAGSPFWRHLPMVEQGQIYEIDPVWAYGGVNSVTRLARLLTDALLAGGSDNVGG
ncbi:MAG: ABC transporter substrate-binding protein, partial [Marinobacter sp.]|uniref:ABC transporter substrate-binding protein n=1 Tax=Marinobacter sp. TaxID=50741 RepID=UPI00299D4E95